MGEAQGRVFELTFNCAAKVEASDCRLTSDAGALVLREVDHRSQLTASVAPQFHNPRNPSRVLRDAPDLERQAPRRIHRAASSTDRPVGGVSPGADLQTRPERLPFLPAAI